MSDSNVEPMELDLRLEEENVRTIITNPTFDLDTYANSYKGLARIFRLHYVAEHCPSLREEALKMAILQVMDTHNADLYRLLVEKMAECNPTHELAETNMEWLSTVSKKSMMRLDQLNNNLRGYKSTSLKHNIRRCYNELGDHFVDVGNLTDAFKCFSRAWDYCASGKNMIDTCLNAIKVSIYAKNWSRVMNFLEKTESIPNYPEITDDNKVTACELKCAAGLAELCAGRFESAAKYFLQVDIDYCDFPDMLSPNNVAVYGGLCALATFDRNDLRKHFIQNSPFKPFLDLEPQIRDIIMKFYDSKYSSCLMKWDELKDNFALDMYLARHTNDLYAQIRTRGILQYFSTYSTADLHRMANAFNTSVEDLQVELIDLIERDKLPGRIDWENKLLVLNEVDHERETYEKALRACESFGKSCKFLMFRAALLEKSIVVK